MSDDFAMSDASRAELSLDSLIRILMKAMKLLETQARVVSNGFDELERRCDLQCHWLIHVSTIF